MSNLNVLLRTRGVFLNKLELSCITQKVSGLVS